MTRLVSPTSSQQWSTPLAPPSRISSRYPSCSAFPAQSISNAGFKSSSFFRIRSSYANESRKLAICIPRTEFHDGQDFSCFSGLKGLQKSRSTRQLAIAATRRKKSGGDNIQCHFSQSDETSPSSPSQGNPNPTAVRGKELLQTDNSEASTAVSPEYTLDSGGLADFSLLQTRRFWLGITVAVSVVLGGNFVGVTSSILSTKPETSRSIRADLLFPVKEFKRCFETTHGFEFIYPASWVGDQRLLYRAAERAERERFLELPPATGQRPPPRRPSSSSTDPIVAFGPPGTDGELNVSVVVAPVSPNFNLQRIGGPKQAGELILQQFIAPAGSKKVATLLNAEQRSDDGQLYYTLEYTVKGSAFFRHNLAVYASKTGSLFSLNAQTAESAWNTVREDFSEVAKSFRLLA